MKRLKIIELSKPPEWPEEMRCGSCGARGVYWIGMTKAAFNLFTAKAKVHKCNECGCGLVQFPSGAILPCFIFKKQKTP